MKDFLTRIGVLQDDKQPAPAKPATSAPLSAIPPDPNAPAPAPIDGEGGSLKLNIESVKAGIEAAIHSTAEFAPVAKFLEAVGNLKDVPGMDEATRFRAALAQTKIPVAELQTAVATHANVLAAETERFGATFVTNVQGEITHASEQISALGAEVEKVQQHLTNLTAQRAQLVAYTNAHSNDLEKAKIDFAQIVKDVDAIYNDLAAKLTKHLGA